MKKYRFNVLGILVLALTLGFVFVGCDNSSGDVQKSIKITGIVNPPNTRANVQVDVNAGDHSNPNGQGVVAMGFSYIVNQTVLVDLYDSNNIVLSENRWTGNGEWCIRLKFFDSTDNHQHDYLWKQGQKYDIKNAITELNFADFVLVWEEGK